MRYVAIVASLIGTLVFGLLIPLSPAFIAPFAVFGVLTLIGVWDMVQTKHSLRRNYPILANIRFMLETIRPEIRQYFLESDTDGVPFNRNKRAVVYQRAKGQLDKRPFGTQHDIYGTDFEWINHSLVPVPPTAHDFRVTVGGPDCRQPYSLSLFNVSAMSFGSLSANAIRALNKGAKLGGFAHDTGEGSISSFNGFFTVVGNEGDTIIFSCIGFKQIQIVVPSENVLQKISTNIYLTPTYYMLAGAVVYPWGSKDQFPYAFIHTDVPDDDLARARKNLDPDYLKTLALSKDSDPDINSMMVLNNYSQSMYYYGQAKSMNIMNPLAWAQFFSDLKNGKYKNPNK